MRKIDQGMIYCFVYGHSKRLMELLEPDEEFNEWGARLDGNGEMEVMGHLRTLSLYTKKLEEYAMDLVQDSGESKK